MVTFGKTFDKCCVLYTGTIVLHHSSPECARVSSVSTARALSTRPGTDTGAPDDHLCTLDQFAQGEIGGNVFSLRRNQKTHFRSPCNRVFCLSYEILNVGFGMSKATA